MKKQRTIKVLKSLLLIILSSLMIVSCSSANRKDGNISTPVSSPNAETTPSTSLPDVALPEDIASTNITFCDTEINNDILSTNSASAYDIVEDRFYGQVLKLTVTENEENQTPYIKINYKEYMKLAGLDCAKLSECKYAVCNIKTEKTYDARMQMTVTGVSNDNTKQESAIGIAEHKKDRLNWQYVVIPLFEDDSELTVDEIDISFLKDPKNGEALYLHSIVFVKNSLEALYAQGIDPYIKIKPQETEIKVEGLTREYKFIHLTDLHMCAISNEDKAIMKPDRLSYAEERRNTFYNNEVYSEDKIFAYYQLAEKKNADLVVMTGDILDFPSKANVSVLYKAASEANVNTLYCLGNHDWSFKDDYHTLNAKKTNIPLFKDFCGGDPYFSYVEYDDLILAAIDNSTDKVTKSTVDKFLALYDKGKPIVLALHVPLYSEKLAEKSIEHSKQNLTMGGEGMHADDENVKRLYEAVCIDEDTPVVAVLSGHLHYYFEESFPNGVPQYVTGTGYAGNCRLISIKPE